jgi:hypothetical protein
VGQIQMLQNALDDIGCVMRLRMRNELPHRGHFVTSTAKTRSNEKAERLRRRLLSGNHPERAGHDAPELGTSATCVRGHKRRSVPGVPNEGSPRTSPLGAQQQSWAQRERGRATHRSQAVREARGTGRPIARQRRCSGFCASQAFFFGRPLPRFTLTAPLAALVVFAEPFPLSAG